MHDIVELNTYKQTTKLSLSRFVFWPVSIDDSMWISINAFSETSTDYSIGISINVIGQTLMCGLNMLTKLTRSALALLLASLSSIRMGSGWDASYRLYLTILELVLSS